MQVTSIKTEGEPLKLCIVIEHLEMLCICAAVEDMMSCELKNLIEHQIMPSKNSFIALGRLALEDFVGDIKDLQKEMDYEPTRDEVEELHTRVRAKAMKIVEEMVGSMVDKGDDVPPVPGALSEILKKIASELQLRRKPPEDPKEDEV